MDFKLEHFDLSNCPPYLALSYTWGNQWPTRGIRLNGSLFTVGENLSSALQCIFRNSGRVTPADNDYIKILELRFGSHKSETWDHATRWRFMEEACWKYVWIDAICIDQVDVLEKNQQVSIMSRIFSSAAFVLVWLGEEKDNSDYAMQDLSNGIGWKVRQMPGNHAQRAVRAFFRRSYWSRLWIIPEFLHAKDIIICCGSKCVQLRTVESWFRGQHRFQRPDASAKSLFGPAYAILDHRFNWNASSAALWRGDPRRMLSIVLQRFVMRECKDPRDKVYGLLSLAGVGRDLGIIVDYNKSTYDLFCDVLRATSESLDVVASVKFERLLAKELGIPPIQASRLHYGFGVVVNFQKK
jgi:hypothetical protein